MGKQITIGAAVRLKVEQPCKRCVVTTLPQAELPRDYAILKTIAQCNNSVLGVYCSVERGGQIGIGDKLQVIA